LSLLAVLAATACGDGSSRNDGSTALEALVDIPAQRAPTGAACQGSHDCQQLVCLTTTVAYGKPLNFPGGYCSAKCKTDAECQGASCIAFTDAAGVEIGRYCLQRCPAAGCRAGYVCSTAGLCYPK
jgi:hypothetical protein